MTMHARTIVMHDVVQTCWAWLPWTLPHYRVSLSYREHFGAWRHHTTHRL